MTQAVETFDANGWKVEILVDNDTSHLWDEWIDEASTGELLWDLAHRRMTLPERRKGTDKTHWRFNVYMYEHSGRTVSLAPFSCRFDSGQLGVLWIPRQRGRTGKKAEEIAKALVSDLDNLLQGNVHGYKAVHEDGREESCWGFIGDPAVAAEEAHSQFG